MGILSMFFTELSKPFYRAFLTIFVQIGQSLLILYASLILVTFQMNLLSLLDIYVRSLTFLVLLYLKLGNFQHISTLNLGFLHSYVPRWFILFPVLLIRIYLFI